MPTPPGVRRIGILTAGGDCPGLNAVIRAVTKSALTLNNIQIVGFKDGYDGLVRNNTVILDNRDVSGILTAGGTILGTSNVADPYRYPQQNGDKVIVRDRSREAIATYHKNNLESLIVVGGDGTLSIATKLIKDGLNIVGVPKTIDNDLSGTDYTFGFDSAVVTATEAIDKLHSTAQSHHRVMIIEVMGRYAGWIALHAGVAGGGDVILIPEIPYTVKSVCAKLEDRRRRGKRFSIIVVAEGAKPKGGKLTVRKIVDGSPDKIRLGGVAYQLADAIERAAHLETRATVLGHVQRGGTPSAYDRTLASRFGHAALMLAARRQYGKMVALNGDSIGAVPITRAVGKLKRVPRNHPLVITARALGTSFGN